MQEYKVGEPIDLLVTEEGDRKVRVIAKKLNSSMPFIECIGESNVIDTHTHHLTVTNLNEPGKYLLRVLATDNVTGHVAERNNLVKVVVDRKEDIIVSALKEMKSMINQGDSNEEELLKLVEAIFTIVA